MTRRRPSRARSGPFSAFRYSILAAACRSSQHANQAGSNARKWPGANTSSHATERRRRTAIRVFEHYAFLLFKKGEVVAQKVGSVPESHLRAFF
jgi:hypothetical protein